VSAIGVAPGHAARLAVTRALSARRGRALRAGLALAAVTLLVACVSVSVGDYPIPLVDVVPALLGTGDEATTIVARELRLPRVLGGLLVGGAFGLSGAIYQAVARNPLASPDILGVLQGGSLAAVFGITVLGASAALVSVSAFGGALLMTVAVYLLAYRQGVSSYRFVLVGIGLAAIGTALINWLLTKADIFSAAAATVWLTGSLNAIGWESVVPPRSPSPA
jgi:iron complex transport system permease protein